MDIGILPSPESHPLWPGIYALLEPAARRAGGQVMGPHYVVWIAMDGAEIIAAATTRMLSTGDAELIDVGGTRFREWLAPWEAMICDWARYNGANKIISGGDDGSRLGWWPFVRRLGWTKQADRHIYEKVL